MYPCIHLQTCNSALAASSDNKCSSLCFISSLTLCSWYFNLITDNRTIKCFTEHKFEGILQNINLYGSLRLLPKHVSCSVLGYHQRSNSKQLTDLLIHCTADWSPCDGSACGFVYLELKAAVCLQCWCRQTALVLSQSI